MKLFIKETRTFTEECHSAGTTIPPPHMTTRTKSGSSNMVLNVFPHPSYILKESSQDQDLFSPIPHANDTAVAELQEWVLFDVTFFKEILCAYAQME